MEDIRHNCHTDLPPLVWGRQIVRRRNAIRQECAVAHELVLWIAELNLIIPYEFSAALTLADLGIFREAIAGMDGRGGQTLWSIVYLPPVDDCDRELGTPMILAAGIGETAFEDTLARPLERLNEQLRQHPPQDEEIHAG